MKNRLVDSCIVLSLGLMISIGALAADLTPLETVTVGGNTILADSHGMSVYVFDKDTAGVSNCNGGCAKAWPPVLLPSGTAVASPLGTVIRQDGSTQITYENRPVYLYIGDEKSGDTTGDGLEGIWHSVNF